MDNCRKGTILQCIRTCNLYERGKILVNDICIPLNNYTYRSDKSVKSVMFYNLTQGKVHIVYSGLVLSLYFMKMSKRKNKNKRR